MKSGLKSACKTCIILATHKYHSTESGRAVRKLHKKISRKRRRDMERGIDVLLTSHELSEIYRRFNNQCFNCRATERLEIDHHKPLSLGHGLTIHNAVLLCGTCNNAKSNKLPEQFYTTEQLLRLEQLMS